MMSTPALAANLSYTYDAPSSGNFGKPTSVEPVTVIGDDEVNVNISKDSAFVPPEFGSASADVLGTGELLTPDIAGVEPMFPHSTQSSFAPGVTENGFGSTGFYVGFLLLIILIVGIYVAYTGLIKRETSKALHAVINFVVVFVLSASFIAYAPDYIKKINDFSSDISTASLDLGTKIMLPDSDSQGKDSVEDDPITKALKGKYGYGL